MNNLFCNESRVEVLKKRVARCVCKYCGQPLTLKRIIFNDFEDARIEIYCGHCERIEYGIEPQIYESATSFVDQVAFNFYPDLPENEKTRLMNIAKICEIMAWGYQHTGFIDQNGFTVSLPAMATSDQCLIICADDVPEQEV